MREGKVLAPEKKKAADPAAKPPLSRVPARISFQLATPGAASAPLEGEAEKAAAAVTGTPTSPGATPAVLGILVDDGVLPGPGQMARSQWLTEISADIEGIADTELRKVGRTSQSCPYIAHWLNYYRTRNTAQIERAIQHYASPARPDVASVRQAITAKVQSAVQTWIATKGRVIQAPPGIDFLGVSDRVLQLSSAASAYFQRSPASQSETAPGDLAPVLDQLGPGRALPGALRDRMQEGFGQDLSSVRLHHDSHAAALATRYQARAFTVGQHIAFAESQYRPGTIGGEALLAHEIAHTIQQRGATGVSTEAATPHAGLEQSANQAAVGALLLRPQPSVAAGGLRLQRCGPSLPEQTTDWQSANKDEYDAAVKRIRELHDEEKKLLAQPGWDDNRVDQLAKIQDGVREQVKKLQDLGIRRDAPDILKRILEDVPEDLRQVTGSIEGGTETIFWGEPRQLRLRLDYLPKNVDHWVQWSFEPNTADPNPLASPSRPVKDLLITLDASFWASFDRFGGSPDPMVRRTEPRGMSIVAKLYLGAQRTPAATFSTQFMKLKEEVPQNLVIEAPRILNLPKPGATAPEGQPAPTTSYAMKDADTDFRLAWSPQLVFTSSPKHLVLWWVKEPGATSPSERKDLQQWSVTLRFPKTGEYIVGAKIFKWDQKPTDTPILSATKTVQSVSHEELGKLALEHTEKQAPNADYQKYLADLDKQIADAEATAKAGTVAPRVLGDRLAQLKEQRKRILEQVGGKGATRPFPDVGTDFAADAVYVANMPAVLSVPEYGGAFPLSVFVTMQKSGGSWSARITDATTQDVIHWNGAGSSPPAALYAAVAEWRRSNEYPQGGSLTYSFHKSGLNLGASFGTSTFKKEFWKWFDRILFISSAIVGLVLLLAPDPTGATKVAGLALLGIGILRSAHNIYNNLSLGRPVLDQRNVLEAINIVASVLGLKGGLMMAGAGKGVALGEQLAGKALTTFKVGKGLVIMSAAADVGTFVYITADAISQLQAAENDPNLTPAQRDRMALDTYLRLVTQGILIIGTNRHLFQGAKPRGTNLGLFLDKVAGPNAEIRLDPSMRTRLLAEFRKINPEAEASTLTDRELVMGLQAVRIRSQVAKALNDIRDSLDAKGKDAFDRKRAEYKSPEEFHDAINAAGNPKEYFAKLATDPDFMSRKVGPDMPYAEQMQRLRKADPKSRIELAPSKGILVHEAGIDIAPDNQIRINGQIDLHPSALKEIPEADLKVLLETTRKIKEGGGKPTKEQAEALKNFTATGGYRFRFEFQREVALKQLDELGLKSHPLFVKIPQEGQNRLIELQAEGVVTGAPNLRKQAADWALSRNPTTVSEFVDLFQFYSEFFQARMKAKETAFAAEVARRMAEKPGSKQDKITAEVTKDLGITGKRKEFFAGEVEKELSAGPDKAKVSDTVRAEVSAAYEKVINDPAAATGKATVDPTLSRDQMTAKIKELKNLTFASPSEIAYHTEKHYEKDVPPEPTAAGTTKVAAYVESARATIANPKEVVARPAQTGGTILTFLRDIADPSGAVKTVRAIVYVSIDGKASILTYYGPSK